MLGPGWVGLAVMISAFDEVQNGRVHLLYRTLKTAVSAFPSSIIYVVDNGSTGDDAALVERMARTFDRVLYRNVGVGKDGDRSPGRLANEKLRILAEEQQTPGGTMPSAVVLCEDDAWWYPSAEKRLSDLWSSVLDNYRSGVPEDLALVGGYLEPVWHWNVPSHVREVPVLYRKPERVLIRPNAPGVAISFLLHESAHGPGVWLRSWLGGGIAPFEASMNYDIEACRRLTESQLAIGQMDLCDHTGWGSSTWGNRAIETALPLDRLGWGL